MDHLAVPSYGRDSSGHAGSSGAGDSVRAQMGTPRGGTPRCRPGAAGARASLGSLITARFYLFVVVDGDLLQILGFENLVAFEATQVIDPIPPHQKLRAVVLTGRHTRCRLSLF